MECPLANTYCCVKMGWAGSEPTYVTTCCVGDHGRVVPGYKCGESSDCTRGCCCIKDICTAC
eukprot:2871191-Pyramimonas_sp.AAC.1